MNINAAEAGWVTDARMLARCAEESLAGDAVAWMALADRLTELGGLECHGVIETWVRCTLKYVPPGPERRRACEYFALQAAMRARESGRVC